MAKIGLAVRKGKESGTRICYPFYSSLIIVANPCNYFRNSCDVFMCPFRTRENKAYKLHLDSQDTLVFCHLNDTGLGECGGGGWTLVIKSDGAKVLQKIFSICLL